MRVTLLGFLALVALAVLLGYVGYELMASKGKSQTNPDLRVEHHDHA